MRITRVELHDIGPFDDAVLEFPETPGPGEVVLFEGPNGCGKTTIAETIAASLLAPDLTRDLSLSRRIRTDGQGTLTLEHQGSEACLTVKQNNPQSGNLRVVLQADSKSPIADILAQINGPRTTTPKTWTAFAFRNEKTTANIHADGPRKINAHPLEGALGFGAKHSARSHFGQFLINVEFERIQSKIYATERSDTTSGSDLSRQTARATNVLDRIRQALSMVLDRQITIDFPIGQNAPRILFNDQEIPIDLLGEGMRNTFSWIADLIIRLERIDWADTNRSPFEQDFWLILDEIEESLHPRMQARILPAIRHLFPNARIYATTHSPFVVASAGNGTVFRIKPHPQTRRVSGTIEPIQLQHGQSLEWVVSEIFDTPSGFIDEETRRALDIHERGIHAFRAKQHFDWNEFIGARDFLLGLNDEVRAVVAMREVPVRTLIAEKLREQAA